MLELKSKIYRITPGQYIKEIAISWLQHYWWVFAVPLMAVLFWLYFDLRAVYIGVMLLFLIYPMVLTIVWVNYAFSPKAIAAIQPQKLIATDCGIMVEYVFDEEHPSVKGVLTIKNENIVSIHARRNYTVIRYGRALDDLILADNQSFDQSEASVLHNIKTQKTADNLDSF